MSISKPLVSICIPTYNGSKYLEECLDSAINQTYKYTEIIVSDDNSQDTTLEIVKKYAEKTSIPFFIYKHTPSGIGANWNNCVRKANGKYIKFLFQDDVLLHECIEKMLFLAEKNDEIGLVFAKRKIIASKTMPATQECIKTFSNLHSSWQNLREINEGKTLLKQSFFLFDQPRNKVGEPSAVLLKRNVFFKIGYFKLKYLYHADWHHNIRWFTNKKIKKSYIPLDIANYADGGASSLYGDQVFSYEKRHIYIWVGRKILTKNVGMVLCKEEFKERVRNKMILKAFFSFLVYLYFRFVK